MLGFYLQFIDGRLDLLNSGEGFSDIFEEEINMGEYAGESDGMRLCVTFQPGLLTWEQSAPISEET